MPILSDILDTVVTARRRNVSGFHEYVYKNLDVRRCQQPAKGNHHLLNPRNDDLGGFSPRDIPLTGSEEISGEFLTLHHGSHDDNVFLLTHDSIDELESEILGLSGLLNPFTSHIDAILGGACISYTITFLYSGTRTTFNKDSQFACEYGNTGASDMSPYKSCRIEWSDPHTVGT